MDAFQTHSGTSRLILIGALTAGLLLGGCSSGGGGGSSSSSSSSSAPEPDREPEQFTFTDKSDTFLATPIDSDPITVSGINEATDISIEGGTYSIGGGDFTDEDQSDAVNEGDEIVVRVLSSPDLDTPKEATLTIGGVSDTFVVTTRSVDAGGIYTGGGSVNGETNNLDPVRAMIHNNRFMVFSVAENVLYDGRIQTYSGDQITALVDVYKDGVNNQQATATGTVTTGSSVELAFTGTGFGNGTITLDYDELYDRDATLQRIEAEIPDAWAGAIYSVMTSGENISIFASLDGTFTASVASPVDCNYDNGVINIPNSDRNLYEIAFDVLALSNCDHLGSNYSGLATIVDNAGTNNVMWFAASNGDNSTYSVLYFMEDVL